MTASIRFRRELRTELPGQALKITAEMAISFCAAQSRIWRARGGHEDCLNRRKVVNLLYVEVPPAEPQIPAQGALLPA